MRVPLGGRVTRSGRELDPAFNHVADSVGRGVPRLARQGSEVDAVEDVGFRVADYASHLADPLVRAIDDLPARFDRQP
jgi:hypothetical protein